MCDRGTRLLLALFLVSGLVLTGGQAWAKGEHPFEVVDSAGIYFGRGLHPKAPALIRADEVWAEIPEYKRIVEKELDESDPAYHLLLKKATARFQKALKKGAKRDGYDMIGEVGSIKANGKKPRPIPDITKTLIELVTRA